MGSRDFSLSIQEAEGTVTWGGGGGGAQGAGLEKGFDSYTCRGRHLRWEVGARVGVGVKSSGCLGGTCRLGPGHGQRGASRAGRDIQGPGKGTGESGARAAGRGPERAES